MATHPLPIILASISQSKTTVLTQSGLHFQTIDSCFDESSITASHPEERAILLAQAKARAAAQQLSDPALIIGADTVVILNNKVLEKPKYKMVALSMLKELSGQIHTVLTGYAVYNSYKDVCHTGTSATYISFRKLTLKEMTDYVNDNPVTQWAGGYNSFLSPAINFITHIEGSLTGLNGLPLDQILPIIYQEWAHPYKKKTK